MSYSFKIVKKGNDLEVQIHPEAIQHIPDGSFEVGGHEDERYVSIWVRRFNDDGTPGGAQASASTTVKQVVVRAEQGSSDGE